MQTGEKILLAKSMGGGWYLVAEEHELHTFLQENDPTGGYGPDAPTELALHTEHDDKGGSG